MMRALVRVMKEHGGGDALAGINWDATLVADVPREMLIEWERSVEAFFLLHSKAKLAELSVANGFGLSGIDAAQDVLGSEQLRYRGLWRQLDDPARNLSLQVPGPLFLSSAGTAAAVRAAPLLPPEQSATESTP
jgi:crotonobetainyl-CoA:carnitine CoA-transferase CaiB-like acyl-CoA transferase